MKTNRRIPIISIILWFAVICVCPHIAQAYKVLVVMSYEQNMKWVREIETGIEKSLGSTCETEYFYLNTKTRLEAGERMAKAAYERYLEFQPHGVIAADDNAQHLFAVPYLRNKVKTPVIFCGVNAKAEKYGYPASNVSGILERHLFREAIAFARQIDPGIRRFGYMIRKSPVGDLILNQIEEEKADYPAQYIGHRMPKTLKETLAMSAELRKISDLMILSTMRGVLDDSGFPLTDRDIIPRIVRTYGKIVVGTEEQVVLSGALCSVVRTGVEQGAEAGKMLLKAMTGTPVSDIPVIQNHVGKRIINADTLKTMGIRPRPDFLRGTELLRTAD